MYSKLYIFIELIFYGLIHLLIEGSDSALYLHYICTTTNIFMQSMDRYHPKISEDICLRFLYSFFSLHYRFNLFKRNHSGLLLTTTSSSSNSSCSGTDLERHIDIKAGPQIMPLVLDDR